MSYINNEFIEKSIEYNKLDKEFQNKMTSKTVSKLKLTTPK